MRTGILIVLTIIFLFLGGRNAYSDNYADFREFADKKFSQDNHNTVETITERYRNEYENTQDYEVSMLRELARDARSYDDILHKIKKLLPYDKPVDATDILINNAIYMSIGRLANMLRDIMINTKPKDESSEIYIKMQEEQSRLIALITNIRVEPYLAEKEAFKKATGKDFDPSRDSLGDHIVTQYWEPHKDYLYRLDNIKVFQTLPKGVLINCKDKFGINEKIAFLYTDSNFVDGKLLNGLFAYYVGTFKYTSMAGTRNVYAFRLFDYNKNQYFKKRQYYYYPELIDALASSRSQAFLSKLTQAWKELEMLIELRGDSVTVKFEEYSPQSSSLPVIISSNSTIEPLTIRANLPGSEQEVSKVRYDLLHGIAHVILTAKPKGTLLNAQITSDSGVYSMSLEGNEFILPSVKEKRAAELEAKLTEKRKHEAKTLHKRVIYETGFDFSDDVAVDVQSGLMWIRNGNLFGQGMTWDDAIDFVRKLNYAGYNDWRLPTKDELIAMSNRGGNNQYEYFNSIGFRNVAKGRYWTATEYDSKRNSSNSNGLLTRFVGKLLNAKSLQHDSDCAWTVEMVGELVLYNIKSWGNYVWPVRGAINGGR